MIPRKTLNILHFLRNNVVEGIETLGQARRFVRTLEGLSIGEKLFLDVALLDENTLEDFHAAFVCKWPVRLTA